MSLIGSQQNQISLNSMLGDLAFQDKATALIGYTFMGIDKITSSTTWVRPNNCRAIGVIAVGAGGGGGGAIGIASGTSCGAGGGSGSASYGFTNNIPKSLSISIGSGGTGGTSSGGNGGTGGDTKISNTQTLEVYLAAGGGTGGSGMPAAVTVPARTNSPGSGGVPIFGSWEISYLPGNPGFYGRCYGTTSISGKGAGSPLGGGEGTGLIGNAAGVTSITKGNGGNGACVENNTGGRAGATGAPGVVYIFKYG